MAKKVKYRKGAQVETVISAVLAILDGRPMYLNDKCQNTGWLQNLNVRTLGVFVSQGRMWFAVKNDG